MLPTLNIEGSWGNSSRNHKIGSEAIFFFFFKWRKELALFIFKPGRGHTVTILSRNGETLAWSPMGEAWSLDVAASFPPLHVCSSFPGIFVEAETCEGEAWYGCTAWALCSSFTEGLLQESGRLNCGFFGNVDPLAAGWCRKDFMPFSLLRRQHDFLLMSFRGAWVVGRDKKETGNYQLPSLCGTLEGTFELWPCSHLPELPSDHFWCVLPSLCKLRSFFFFFLFLSEIKPG